MSIFVRSPSPLAFLLMLGLGTACSGGDDTPPANLGGDDGGGGDGDGGEDPKDGGGTDDPDGEAEDGGVDSDGRIVCGLSSCGAGQRCDDQQGAGTCIDNACSDLTCSATEECTPAAGGGNVCKSIACASDVQCGESRHCDGSKCVDDVCESSVQRCSGNQVFQCASNGGSDEARFSCTGSQYFSSSCGEATSGTVGCSCQDDWDCPNFTACNAGTCQGTGKAPTCTLPAARIQDVLPTLEFRWGGASTTSRPAMNRPFPAHAQVSSTPIVANLDDDNGDGLINELDFPEIIFTTYVGDIYSSAVVRAVHGGGPQRGNDYFALCGTTRPWFEGDSLATAADCPEAILRSGAGLAVGDLDNNGVPEILVATHTGKLLILDNRGRFISESAVTLGTGQTDRYPQIGLANLDNVGMVEVIIGNRVFTLEKTAAPGNVIQVVDIFTGAGATGAQDDGNREFGPTACPANVIDSNPNDQDATQEIVVGTVLYRLPAAPAGVTRVSQCAGGDASDFCKRILTKVWDARDPLVNTAGAVPNVEAYCAVADVLGANTATAPGPANGLDGVPEVILVSSGRLIILNASTGALLQKRDVEPGARGGAPNVDDFDGDGYPEIAMASSGFYTVIDLQDPSASFCPAWPTSLGMSTPAPGTNAARNPGGTCTSNAQCNSGSVCNTTLGSCVCLHNGWKRITEDDSSKVTSSSVFDFNGDGAAEVVYNDECYFRVYDGISGDVRLAVPSVSRTVLENPVVADVDNDGNAEIVFVNNNETLQCSQTTLTNPDGTTIARDALPNGIQVWGDASDTWVSARRIWNQHAYHVTNVTEGGQIPVREPESWKPYGNRIYNTYRSQPRAYGVAPDLSLIAMQVSSPDVSCGQLSDMVEIVVLVKNLGDLRVGPGVDLTFYGEFGGAVSALNADNGTPLKFMLATSLEPGASQLITVPYRAQNNPAHILPSKVIARIDEAGKERECVETNNQIEQDVKAGEQLADLRLEIGSAATACVDGKIKVTVHNDGSLAASDVLVRLYAGNPSAGGQSIGEGTIAGPIEPGASAELTIVNMVDRNITVYGMADPLDAIEECNNANNQDEGPEVMCSVIIL